MAQSSLFSNVDEYGFERSEDFDYQTYEEFMENYLNVLTTRAKKWARLLGDGKSLVRSNLVKRHVRKGIPSEHRGAIWMSISGAEAMREKSPDLYQQLLDQQFEKELVTLVKTDLPRTFPENIYFNRSANYQSNLYNILIAYAHNNKTVGYCQGLNYIAGLLLLATKSEDTSFWLLKVLVEEILPDYYCKTMDGLIVDIEVLSELVKAKVPDVHQHVINLGLPWAVITTKWFVCLFAEVLPIETVLRIWDCIFYEGSKILFRVCLTLVKANRAMIMRCNDFSTLADCFKTIVKNTAALHCHEFMQSIFKVPGTLSNTTITKLRLRYRKQRMEQLRNDQRLKDDFTSDYRVLSIKNKNSEDKLHKSFLPTLWPHGKEVALAKLNDFKALLHLSPQGCHPMYTGYTNLKGGALVMDDLDGFGGATDFDVELFDET